MEQSQKQRVHFTTWQNQTKSNDDFMLWIVAYSRFNTLTLKILNS